MRRILTWLVVASSFVIVGPAGDALACSCAMPDPAQMLAESDAAFVGALVERPEEPAGDDFMGIWVFEVEEWVKGDLGPQVGVHAALGGAGCGFEVAPGERIGVFLYNDDGRPSGGLCSTTTPDALLAADQPLVFDGVGPPVFLIAGDGGRTRIATLDASGRLLQALDDGRFGWSVSLCPGNDRFAEVSNEEVLVRATSDLAVVAEVETDMPQEVWCLDAAGNDLLVSSFVGDRMLLRRLPSGEVLAEGDFAQHVVNPGHVATVRLPADHLIDVVSLDSGASTVIDTGTGAIGSIYLHPTLPRLLVTKAEFPPNGGYWTTATVYEVESGEIVWKSGPLENTDVYGFIDEHRLIGAVYPIEAETSQSIVIDTEHEVVEEASITGWSFFATDDGVVSVDNGALMLASNSGEIARIASLPSPNHRLIGILDSGADIIATASEEEPVEPSTPPTQTEAAPPVTEREGFPWAVAGAALGAVGLVLAVGWRAIRDRSRTSV